MVSDSPVIVFLLWGEIVRTGDGSQVAISRHSRDNRSKYDKNAISLNQRRQRDYFNRLKMVIRRRD
ncbi:hypothetical protein [Cupriavidus sp. H18C2]|uniref:hypothetical protein n=1 Tax=Cupriavidus sp. H18C2 TaxID=3241602 RepID=UPI003BF8495F